jgi:hypothetical protein
MARKRIKNNPIPKSPMIVKVNQIEERAKNFWGACSLCLLLGFGLGVMLYHFMVLHAPLQITHG